MAPSAVENSTEFRELNRSARIGIAAKRQAAVVKCFALPLAVEEMTIDKFSHAH